MDAHQQALHALATGDVETAAKLLLWQSAGLYVRMYLLKLRLAARERKS